MAAPDIIKMSDMSEVTELASDSEFIVFGGKIGYKVTAGTLTKVLQVKAAPTLNVTLGTAGEVTVTNGTDTLTDTGTNVTFALPGYGTYTVTAGGSSQTLEVDTVKIYNLTF